MRVINVVDEKGSLVCDSCGVVEPPLAPLRALARRRWPEHGRGLLLRKARGVHTWFMRKPIDVVFLDDDFRVLRIVRNLRPGTTVDGHGSDAALELPAGAADGAHLLSGMRLGWGVPDDSPQLV